MGKPTRTKKPEILGKGKVTPVQIGFIVDRYLSDNNYTQTRSVFRTEASNIIAKTHAQEAPKSLLSLAAILDEYICLKEQKVMFDQEKRLLEHEKCRVETLLKGMQNVMQAYNSAEHTSLPLTSSVAAKSTSLTLPSDRNTATPAGFAMSRTPNTHSLPRSSNSVRDATNFSTPTNDLQAINKRKGLKTLTDAPPMAKRPCNQMHGKLSPIGSNSLPLQSNYTISTQETVNQSFVIQSSPSNCLPNGTTQGSSVVKSLFKQPPENPQTNPPDPKTPPQALPSSSDKTVSPFGSSSRVCSADDNQKTTPIGSMVSSEAVNRSPFKHITYYSKETNHYISPSPIKTNSKKQAKRDNVKGRLDFDGSDVTPGTSTSAETFTPGSNGEVDIFDMDMPNFDIFGADFNFSELLIDIDLDCDGDGLSSLPTLTPSGSPNGSGSGGFETNEVLSEVSTTITEVLSEKDMNIQGPDSMTSVKSVMKCIRILSPVKSRSPSLDQENMLVQD